MVECGAKFVKKQEELAHAALESRIADIEFSEEVVFQNLAIFFETLAEEKRGFGLRGLHVFSLQGQSDP